MDNEVNGLSEPSLLFMSQLQEEMTFIFEAQCLMLPFHINLVQVVPGFFTWVPSILVLW